MPNSQIKSLTFDGTTYDIVDETSGYSTVSIDRKVSTGVNILDITIDGTKTELYAPTGGGGGSVTEVGISNATNGGLSVSGSPITSSGTISVGHSNVLTSAQTTQALYPIKIDKNGHISAYGSAVSIPTSASSNTTGVSIADHSTTSIYGVGSSTTSVTGVQSSTTTASKASGANGSAPTLGTAFTVPNITSVGSASTWAFEDVTVPIRADNPTSIPNVTNVGSASTWTFEEKTIPNVTAAGSGSFTQGSFSGGSLTMNMNSTDTKQLDIVFTAATHGTDSHTHTAPTLGTAIKVQSKSGGGNGTAPTLGTAISIYGVKSGTSSTTTASHVTGGSNSTVPTLGTAFTIPNVTSAGSASTWSFTDVTVPIKNTSSTTVPIKDGSSTTVVTSKTHSITDNGHTHSLT